MALAGAAPLAPPDASARKKLSLKKKKQRCLKRAAKKRSTRARRSAARRCRRRYAARKPAVRAPARTPAAPPSSAPSTPPPGVPLSRYVSVTSREFTLTLSRPLVGAGEVTIELRNYGEDPHDLVVERSGTPVGSWGEIGPGAVSTKKLALSTGSYKLFCSIEGHEQLGMKATLKVGG